MLVGIVSFVPKFVSGLIVLLIGIIIASFLKQVVIELLKFLKVDVFLKKYGVPETKKGAGWSTLLGELLRWFVIILFLAPTADIWGLTKFADMLNGLLAYLPNVFVAALILLVGLAIASLMHDIVQTSIRGVSENTADTVATVTRWAITVFVILVVLNQLGIASDLIRILFTGIVAMVAIAGGLAFGFGGRDIAKDILEDLRKKL
jgi:hypothetical protein